MQRGMLVVASVTGFLGVAAGAFGAHGLEGRVSVERLAAWKTGAEYQLVHAVVLLVLAGLPLYEPRWQRLASFAFITGVLVFSGSLYVLVLSGRGMWGAVTPIGGVLLLLGWALLGVAGVQALRKGTDRGSH